MTASVVLVIPKGVELFDVDGIPVTIGNVPGSPFSATAWDTNPRANSTPTWPGTTVCQSPKPNSATLSRELPGGAQ
jgi:hypothetical protein